jgi:hypothetical protein
MTTTNAMTTSMNTEHGGPWRLRVAASLLLACVWLALAGASSAWADFGLLPGAAGFDGSVTNQDGSTATQAGSHPFAITTTINFNATVNRQGQPAPDGSPRDIQVDVPPGLVGNPTAISTCTVTQLSTSDIGDTHTNSCPASSQIGTTVALLTQGSGIVPIPAAVFNMQPPRGQPAEFGFDILGVNVLIGTELRTGSDYGVSTTLHQISSALPLTGATLSLWGVPGDPVHDIQRCLDLQHDSSYPTFNTCDGSSSFDSPNSFDLPVEPFLTLPTSCSGPQTVSIATDQWLQPGRVKPDGAPDLSDPAWVTSSFVSHDGSGHPVGADGCNRLDFSPTITVRPDTASADAPAGLNVDLHLPQSDNADALGEADLREAVVTLPAGFSVNPAAANGLEACSPAQIDLTGPGAATCPDASKVGSVEIDTPLLDHPVKGGVYIAKQNDNPFNSLLAIYIAVDDPQTGIVVKLAGHVEPDPVTGQLKTTFDNNPQLPFSDLKVDFFGGPRGALATPQACGTYTATAELTPWSGTAPVTRTDSFDITSGCVNGFHPTFTAGTKNTQAGAFSPFVLSFSRSDTDEELAGLKATLPTGLLAKVAGVPLCSDADAAAGTCPEASQIGSVTAGSGAGSAPLFLPGKAFLTGPYKGGPYGLAVVVPAKAGPFDLGNVVVRQKLEIDPIDAHVTATSDPFPTILQGIPLRVRRVDVTLDRPDFTLNPTSCAAKQIQAQLVSTTGTLADLSAPFSVGGCGDLAYAPKLAISLTGKGQTTDDKHPGVHAVLTQPTGQANNKKVTVSLPLSLALDPDNAQSLCEFTDGSKVDPTCPKGSIVGTATAKSPILDQPLTGPVYFVKNIRIDAKSGRQIRTLPKLVIPLTGQNGLRLTVTGTSNVVDNQLVTTFDNLPDAPVSDFSLDIDGGKHGILVVSGTDICKATQIATRQADGQNGKTADASFTLSTPACPLKIIRKKVSKTSVAVNVGGLGAGKVTVSGKGIKKTTKTIASSTVATITAKRTKGKPGKVTVSFDPTGPAKAHKTTK